MYYRALTWSTTYRLSKCGWETVGFGGEGWYINAHSAALQMAKEEGGIEAKGQPHQPSAIVFMDGNHHAYPR